MPPPYPISPLMADHISNMFWTNLTKTFAFGAQFQFHVHNHDLFEKFH